MPESAVTQQQPLESPALWHRISSRRARHEAIEQRGQLGGVGDLLEPEDRPGSSPSASSSTLRRSEIARTIPRAARGGAGGGAGVEARPLPEAEDLDEDVGPGRPVDEAVVGDPDPLAAELDDLGRLGHLPGRGDLAEPVEERGRSRPGRTCRRRPGARPGRRPPRGGSSAARASGPSAARRRAGSRRSAERRQEQGHLEAVLVGGAEEAQRAVDVEDVAVAMLPSTR